MYDPVASQSLLTAAVAGAVMVLCGALYAALFALARLGRRPGLMPWAYAVYGLLAVATLVLGRVLNLDGFWSGVVFLMLAGYLAGPHVIWKLCVGTHAGVDDTALRRD